MYKWLFLILCVAARPCLSLFQLNYTSLGCWKDTAVRAVPSKEGDPILGSSNYTQRMNASLRCAQVAFNHSFQVFVVQNGGWCGASANASSTYKTYGPSTLCAADGKGGLWANNVYQLSPLVSAWTRYNNFEYATSVAQNYVYKEAKTICSLFNATLALPKTAGVRTFLQTLNFTSPIRNWIGLQNDSTTAENFRWEDGSLLLKSELNYGSSEPSSPAKTKMICMVVDQQLLWYVRRCDLIRGYICQRPAGPTTNLSGRMNVGRHLFPQGKKRITVVYDRCYAVKPIAVLNVVAGLTTAADKFTSQLVTSSAWGFEIDVVRTDQTTGWSQTNVSTSWTSTFNSSIFDVNPCGIGKKCTNLIGGHVCPCSNGTIGSYCSGSTTVITGRTQIGSQMSTVGKHRVKIAFESCHNQTPTSVYAVVTGSSTLHETFTWKLVASYFWGFVADIIRTDGSSGWNQTTVFMDWNARFGSQTLSPSLTSQPMSSAYTTQPQLESSIAISASPSIIYCNRTSISVPLRNASYTFPRTKAGLTSVSFEKCQNGNPIASVDCIISSTQPNKAYFGVPFTIDCSTTLATVALQINSSNATTTSVQNTVATLKLLTSKTSAMTSTHITQAVTTLSSLSQTNQQTVNITINTMYDALVTADHISASYGQASNVTSTSKTTANHQEKQSVVKAISAFADRVILPSNFTNIKLTTTQITLQVTEPTTINGKHASVTFGSSGNVSDQPVAVSLPGSLFDEAHSTLYPRVKRAAATSASPMRASVVVYHNNTLFPATQNPPVILSVQIRGYQPSTTTTGIQINFTNTKAKQGSVPFKNGSLKETVTRTQCNVYQASDGSWHPNGCTLVLGSSPPRCSCNKLASFSMIVSTKVFPSAFAQGVVSYIGCSLSILGLVITIFVYLFIKQLRTRQPTKFLLNICFNLLLVNLIFVFGAANVDHSSSCYVLAALMHFFLLATWFWMSANAHNMYKALVEMMVGGEKSFVVPTLICYLVPFMVVLINSTITVFYVDKHNHVPDDPFFESSYRARNMCWLREYSLNFGFLLPVGVLALFNMICFIVVMVKITCKKSNIQSTANKRSKKEDFIIAISVCVVMGLTWLFGFFMMVADNVIYQTVMSWLFTIFNSTQGLFIFLMNCVRQKKVRDMWWLPLVACVTCKKLKARDRENSVFYTSNIRSTN